MATFVDTFFVIAYINEEDEFHEQARALAPVYLQQRLVTTEAILLEIGNGLARRFKADAIGVIQDFKAADNVEIVNVTPGLFDRGFDLYRRFEDKQWGLVDCISFMVMRERGITDALTFDQHFTQAGFNALMREPA